MENALAAKPAINNIILAEDDSDDLYIFKEILTEVSPVTKLEIVNEGKELLSLLNNFCPDLLFLDLDMPNKNGLECLTEIRSNPSLAHLPVIILSSTNRSANIQTAYELGAHLFMYKSSMYQDYCNSIKTILEYDWSDPEKIRNQFFIDGKFTVFG